MFNLIKGLVSLPFKLTSETLSSVAGLLDISEEELVGLVESGEIDLEEIRELLDVLK